MKFHTFGTNSIFHMTWPICPFKFLKVTVCSTTCQNKHDYMTEFTANWRIPIGYSKFKPNNFLKKGAREIGTHKLENEPQIQT